MFLFAVPSRACGCPSQGEGAVVTVGGMEGCGDCERKLCVQVPGLLLSEAITGSHPVPSVGKLRISMIFPGKWLLIRGTPTKGSVERPRIWCPGSKTRG